MRGTRLPQNQGTLDGAKHVALLGSPVGGEGSSRGEGGDRVGLVLPLSPGCGFREVCAPLGVARHVDQIQVGRDMRLKRAVGRQGFNGAAPVAETLTGTWQPDAPLMHAQDLGAKGDLVLIDEPFGIGRPQELAHLDGSRHSSFAASKAACE